MGTKTSDENKGTTRRRLVLAATTVALLGGSYWCFRPRAKPPAKPVPAPSAVASAVAPAPIVRRHRHRAIPRAEAQAKLEAVEKSATYPPTSRPMSEMPFYAKKPDTLPPPVRSETTGSGHKIELHESQDRQYVCDGESAVVTVQVLVDGKPADGLDVSHATLVELSGVPRKASDPVETAELRDDGIAPDEHANDGTLTGAVPFSDSKMGAFIGDTQLTVPIQVPGDVVSSVFGFVYTGKPPAEFTGRVRDAIEDGSLVFRLGIDVHLEGPYVIHGRLYDAQGNAIVFMDGSRSLTTADRDVKLVAFGKLLRDLDAEAPFTLRDVDAYRPVDGTPDRQAVPTFDGPYRTRRYRPSDFSDRPWTNPEPDPGLERAKAELERASAGATTPAP